MANKLGKRSGTPGEATRAFGTIIIALSVILFLMATFGGGIPNFAILIGGPIIGLLMICAGYLKQIARNQVSSQPVSEPLNIGHENP